MQLTIAVLPRLIRFRDAPAYLGMDRNRFNAEVRPTLTEIPIGRQGIAFDRLELDVWVDDYVSCNGRPAAAWRDRPVQRIGTASWQRARKRAAGRYPAEIGGPSPDGFRRFRVHNLKHTYDRRLRATGVSLEDRQDLPGHKSWQESRPSIQHRNWPI